LKASGSAGGAVTVAEGGRDRRHAAASLRGARGHGGEEPMDAAPAGCLVRVSLYGGLARLMPARPTIVQAPRGATVAWILGELGRTLGPAFTEGVMHSPREKRGVCRIFLDGLPVELDDPLSCADAAVDLDLIVLTAIEGG